MIILEQFDIVFKRPYISGVFLEFDTYKNYLDRYPDLLKPNLKEIKLEGNLPLLIIEDKSGFEYLTQKDILSKRIENIKKVEDDDFVYFNLYIVKNEYISNDPARDEMGIINHFHIQNYDLDFYSQKGLSWFGV